MGTNNQVSDKAKRFEGLRSGMPIEDYGIQNAEEMKNFVLKDGQLKKVNGTALYANLGLGDSGGINSIHRLKDTFIAQRGTILGRETGSATKVFTQITTLLSEKRLFSAHWRDRIFFTNTVDATMLLDRNRVATPKYGTIGLDPPEGELWDDVTPTSVNAGNVPDGQYYYVYTLYDEETNSESPGVGSVTRRDGMFALSPNEPGGPQPNGVIVVAGPKEIRLPYAEFAACLNQDLLSSPRATHFILYRGTRVGGGVGLYESFNRVPDPNTGSVIHSISGFLAAATDFIDNTETLAAVSLPENNSPPPTPTRMRRGLDYFGFNTLDDWLVTDYSGFRQMVSFRDQLFGFGAKSPGVTIRGRFFDGSSGVDIVSGVIDDFSGLLHGSEVYQPDYWPYVWEVGRGDGQEAIGLGILADTAVILLKSGSAYYLSGSSPADFTVRPIDQKKGAVHEGTIQSTSIGVISLDLSGFVLWRKIGEGENISDDIQDIVDRIQFEYASTFYSSYDPKEQRYYCSVVVPGSQIPNLTLCLDLKTMQWSSESGREGLCRFIDPSSSRALLDVVGVSNNDRILDLSDERNVTVQGSQIEAVWTSGTISFGDDQKMKRAIYLYLRAKSASSWKVDIEIIPDYDEDRKYVVRDFDVLSTNSLYYSSDVATDGNLLWEVGKWAKDGLTRQVAKIPIGGMGYTFQVRIINKEYDATRYGFTIESVSIEATIRGK